VTAARSTRTLLVAAIVLGVTAERLLDAPAPSLGFAIAAFAVVAFTFTRVQSTAVRVLLGLMAAAALMLVLRSAEQLNVFSIAMFVGCGLTALWISAEGAVIGARAWDLLRAARSAALTFIVGAGRLVARSGNGEATVKSTRLSLVLGGAIVALPILAAATALLGNADPVFGRGLETIGDFISQDLIQHVVVSLVLAWIIAGWLQGTVQPTDKFTESSEAPKFAIAAHLPALLGFTVLLAAFIGVQARSLFGGAEFVRQTAGLSFADYARGGFFELVGVAFLALGLLIVVDATLDRSRPEDERRFRAVGATLIVLVGVVALSAFHRMTVYVGAFGLSEDRVYALAAIIAVLGALIWFAITVLRGQSERLMPGLFVGCAAFVFTLHIIDPDALVSRVNLARATPQSEFDVAYHVALSADAVPQLLRGARVLGVPVCEHLVGGLRDRWVLPEGESSDWRAWNRGLARARRALSHDRAELLRTTCAE